MSQQIAGHSGAHRMRQGRAGRAAVHPAGTSTPGAWGWCGAASAAPSRLGDPCGQRCADDRARRPCAATPCRSPRWCRRGAAGAPLAVRRGLTRSRGSGPGAVAPSTVMVRPARTVRSRPYPQAISPRARQCGQRSVPAARCSSATSAVRAMITAKTVHGASALPATRTRARGQLVLGTTSLVMSSHRR